MSGAYHVRFGEQPAKPGLAPRRPVEGCHERLPAFVIQLESCLVGQGLFRLLACAAHNKVRNADALAFGSDFDEALFGSGSPKLQSPVAWLSGSGDARGGTSALMYYRCTPNPKTQSKPIFPHISAERSTDSATC